MVVLLTIALGTVNAIDNLTRQTLAPERSGRTSARSGQLQQRDDQGRPVTGRLVDDDDEKISLNIRIIVGADNPDPSQ
ncbi:hypothetical protein ACFY0A_30360 [Streptomyces sp. NPDC001698]|uniref:hypothetical protein n=1 Tax=Streptomyces sp. NPDC001698 TaxID=3364601 RepID=UPI00368F58CB